MNDSNVITSEDGRMASVLYALKKCAKEVDKLMDDFHPPLGGERYMTDKEVIARLKVSRRTLQEYRSARRIPFILFGGKVLYRETDIEKMLAENYRKAIP
ncbi:helix-turn-helix domain-containing protein [Parabacteroides bouchesdurhonensis]|uniref:helix-turn-helix domain-containing protein n=1 Tax=Parabacteroides bouchesdurhonensis TaxID=1936995 RepID=UPI000C81DD90|nr:helix-turn-helix domain-containing protein [Parabacteroides bouchesdurhonensis]